MDEPILESTCIRPTDQTGDQTGDHWRQRAALAERVSSGQSQHWELLWTQLAPSIEHWVARLSFFQDTGQNAVHCHDVSTKVWEKLCRDRHRTLSRFFTSDKARRLLDEGGPDARADYFRAWLQVLVQRVAIDHLRAIPEFTARRIQVPDDKRDGSQQRWRVVEALTTGKGQISNRVERQLSASEILAFLDSLATADERRAVAMEERGQSAADIARTLGLGSPEQAARLVERGRLHMRYRPALEMWCACYTPADIARHLGLSEVQQATRLIKAAKEALRREFAYQGPPAEDAP